MSGTAACWLQWDPRCELLVCSALKLQIAAASPDPQACAFPGTELSRKTWSPLSLRVSLFASLSLSLPLFCVLLAASCLLLPAYCFLLPASYIQCPLSTSAVGSHFWFRSAARPSGSKGVANQNHKGIGQYGLRQYWLKKACLFSLLSVC